MNAKEKQNKYQFQISVFDEDKTLIACKDANFVFRNFSAVAYFANGSNIRYSQLKTIDRKFNKIYRYPMQEVNCENALPEETVKLTHELDTVYRKDDDVLDFSLSNPIFK